MGINFSGSLAIDRESETASSSVIPETPDTADRPDSFRSGAYRYGDLYGFQQRSGPQSNNTVDGVGKYQLPVPF